MQSSSSQRPIEQNGVNPRHEAVAPPAESLGVSPHPMSTITPPAASVGKPSLMDWGGLSSPAHPLALSSEAAAGNAGVSQPAPSALGFLWPASSPSSSKPQNAETPALTFGRARPSLETPIAKSAESGMTPRWRTALLTCRTKNALYCPESYLSSLCLAPLPENCASRVGTVISHCWLSYPSSSAADTNCLLWPLQPHQQAASTTQLPHLYKLTYTKGKLCQ
jgi:hypothetical protein